MPAPPTRRDRIAEEIFARVSSERARKLGISRRAFVESAAGMATALWIINYVYGCGTNEANRGGAGPYEVDAASTLDAAKACETLTGDELIFDVQLHHVDPKGSWRQPGAWWEPLIASFAFAACGESDKIRCFGVDHFLEEVYLKSDTAIGCLSGVPAEPTGDPLSNEARVVTRELVDRLSGSQRLLLHVTVLPNLGASQLDAMQAWAEKRIVGAWKVFPSFGAWRMNEDTFGTPFLERARKLGVKVVAAHRGFGDDAGGYTDFSSPRDLVLAARAFPDLTFLAYHSGYESSDAEGAYASAAPRGVDRLVRALEETGVAPNTGNVYAEVGSTWRALMTKPVEAAHFFGKLMKYVGEDRILWGTDCIWHGSPQEQIAAFRAFQIPKDLQDQFGYPPLTREAKRKIFGLNGMRVYGLDPAATRCKIRADDVAKLKTAARGMPMRQSEPLGPRTRRELFSLLRAQRSG